MSCQPGIQADGAVDSRFVSLSPSPWGIVFGDGAFGNSSVYGGGALVMGSVPFLVRDQRACFLPLHHLRTQQGGCLQARERDQTQGVYGGCRTEGSVWELQAGSKGLLAYEAPEDERTQSHSETQGPGPAGTSAQGGSHRQKPRRFSLLLSACRVPPPVGQGPDDRVHTLASARAGRENGQRTQVSSHPQSNKGLGALLPNCFLQRNVTIRPYCPYIARSPCQHSHLGSYFAF